MFRPRIERAEPLTSPLCLASITVAAGETTTLAETIQLRGVGWQAGRARLMQAGQDDALAAELADEMERLRHEGEPHGAAAHYQR